MLLPAGIIRIKSSGAAGDMPPAAPEFFRHLGKRLPRSREEIVPRYAPEQKVYGKVSSPGEYMETRVKMGHTPVKILEGSAKVWGNAPLEARIMRQFLRLCMGAGMRPPLEMNAAALSV